MKRCWMCLVIVVPALSVLSAGTAAPDKPFKIPQEWVAAPDNDKSAGEAGYRILHKNTGMQLVWVPGGTFKMGDVGLPKTRIKDEEPVHDVELDGYWIGRTEVTVAQWWRVMKKVPAHNDRGDDHPVVNVTWNECQEFCRRMRVLLPTEAQWEFAARGPKNLRFPWGNKWEESNSFDRPFGSVDSWTCPVGTHPVDRSWCGAMDMGGNAAEWCADRYAADYYARSPRRNPTGPDGGDRRVVRGWTFQYHRYPHEARAGGNLCRAAGRDWNYPDDTGGSYGFRVSISGP